MSATYQYTECYPLHRDHKTEAQGSEVIGLKPQCKSQCFSTGGDFCPLKLSEDISHCLIRGGGAIIPSGPCSKVRNQWC